MQIFATSPDPAQCAQWLDDSRVNKMLTESAQIICTILHSDGVKDLPFKPTHESHPVVKWAADTDANLFWTLQHHVELENEWRFRFDKAHASRLSARIINEVRHTKAPKTFQNSAKNESWGLGFTWVEDVHRAYRMYLRARWFNATRKPRWTKRCEPNWRDDLGTDDYVFLCQRAYDLIECAADKPLCPRCGEVLEWKQMKSERLHIKCPQADCLLWKEIPR